jgi:uncharacterized RDD family membrane protein YckC/predicted RNA-binding Zn-ribbon protein involved in translation (DUF1610 family)
MPFSVTCQSCSKVLKVPDAAIGKKGRCPQCGTVIDLSAPPVAEPPPQVFDAEQFDDAADPAPGMMINIGAGMMINTGEGRRKPCPKCGEMILETARKCRYCNEYFDPALRAASSGGVLASPWIRLGAALLDGLVAFGIVVPGLIILFAGMGPREEMSPISIFGLMWIIVGILALVIYQWVLLSTKGQTIGKRWLKIRIVRYDDGGPVGFGKAVALRSWVPGLIGNIPMVGPFFSLADPLFIFSAERRCLHDLIAGTKVVCV